MRIRDISTIIGSILLVVIVVLVIANTYGFYNMRLEREQLRGTYEVEEAVLDLNVLAAEMQLRRSSRVNRQFDDRIGRLEELLQELSLGAEENRQIISRMVRHTARLKQSFISLQDILDNDKFTDQKRVNAVRAVTRSFLASTTALASLSERLTAQHLISIARIENYLLSLNIATAVILVGLLFAISFFVQHRLLKPILNLRARIESLADIDHSKTKMVSKSSNEIDEISAEFDRRIEAFKKVEAERKRFADELQRSNTELEQFAYVASHDLRAPLKGIQMTASWVADDMAEYMTDDTRESLMLLQSRAERLDGLLNSLLQYSRVRSKPHEELSIEVADVISEVELLLSLSDGFTIKVEGALPCVVAERIHLQQVFQNLIENAVKHHDQGAGVITIAAQDKEAYWGFSVTDDGPGIPAQFHEKVQQIFQTLVRRDEREASGMGLALVKKIIEQNGGKLKIDSPLNGRGCAMRFTWPKDRENHVSH